MKQSSSQLFAFLLHSAFAVLAVMAVVLFKERLYADASYYFFHAINSGTFHVEHGRIVLGISQLLPLIGYYLGLPLKYLMVLGSLGHEVFYYAICLFIFYKLKDQAGAITVLLIHVIGQLWLYYSPMLEICYGAALSVLFYSILKAERYKDDKWLIFLLLVQWFAMSSHPENYLLILFALFFDFLNRGLHKRVHLSCLILFVIAISVETLTFSSYELNHINATLNSSGGGNWLNLFNWDYTSRLVRMFILFFPEVLLFLFISLTLSLFKKRFLVAGLIVFSFSFLVLLINEKMIANEFGRYIESMYSPLVFITSLPLVYQLYQFLPTKWTWAISALLFGIIGLRIFWIWDYGQPLQQRVNQLERIVDHVQYGSNTNFLINKANYERSYSNIAWSQSIESLLFSAMDGKEATVSVPTTEDFFYKENQKKLTDSMFIFRRFEIEPLDFLNPRFFNLKNKDYQFLNTGGSTDFSDSINEKIVVSLILPNEPLSFKRDETVFQKVHLFNWSEIKIPSALEVKVFIACHWYKAGETYKWDGLRTPLEVDLIEDYIQDIQLAIPNEPGEYELVPDLVIEGERWIGLKNSYRVRVN